VCQLRDQNRENLAEEKSAMARSADKARKHEASLRAFALEYPEAYEEFPWGERVFKVRNKIFVFAGCNEQGLGFCAKLPQSSRVALIHPFTKAAGYGLGKSGWVEARFGPDDDVPLELLKEWIDESYRAIAPKKLVALLDGEPQAKENAKATKPKAKAKGPKSKK
jgi:predicted DNA-binding protein (MmcQ/YjbR family)